MLMHCGWTRSNKAVQARNCIPFFTFVSVLFLRVFRFVVCHVNVNNLSWLLHNGQIGALLCVTLCNYVTYWIILVFFIMLCSVILRSHDMLFGIKIWIRQYWFSCASLLRWLFSKGILTLLCSWFSITSYRHHFFCFVRSGMLHGKRSKALFLCRSQAHCKSLTRTSEEFFWEQLSSS